MTCNKMDESQRQNDKWEKPDSRVHTVWFYYIKLKSWQNEPMVTEHRRAVTSGRIQTTEGQKGTFWVAGNVLYLHLVCGYMETYIHIYM